MCAYYLTCIFPPLQTVVLLKVTEPKFWNKSIDYILTNVINTRNSKIHKQIQMIKKLKLVWIWNGFEMASLSYHLIKHLFLNGCSERALEGKANPKMKNTSILKMSCIVLGTKEPIGHHCRVPYILSEACTTEMILYSQAESAGLKKNSAIMGMHQQSVIRQLT